MDSSSLGIVFFRGEVLPSVSGLPSPSLDLTRLVAASRGTAVRDELSVRFDNGDNPATPPGRGRGDTWAIPR